MPTEHKDQLSVVRGGRADSMGQSPWKGKYDPQQFIVPGQDHNGHSERVYCRVTPALDRSIEVLVGSKRFPFRSKGDLVRWCVKVGVERLEEMENMPEAGVKMAMLQMDVLRHETIQNQVGTMFASMAKCIQEMVQGQSAGRARRIVSEWLARIDQMEDAEWRDKYRQMTMERFGYLLDDKSATGVKLGEAEDRPLVDEDE